jgi:hypothetical protein
MKPARKFPGRDGFQLDSGSFNDDDRDAGFDAVPATDNLLPGRLIVYSPQINASERIGSKFDAIIDV